MLISPLQFSWVVLYNVLRFFSSVVFFVDSFLVVKWECKWRWMSVLHVYIPVSLGTTAFDRLCMADARAAWFSELDLSVKMKVIET